ncbi:profilin [Streptomyces sp. NPDC058459]|uniref:profilin n=1 Tax=Streptomyces sp. NPDC058459 TaxID=3346508 RepID=UPI00365191EB
MSSWQEYVDEQLVGTGHVRSGAIIGVTDGGTWAASRDVIKANEGPVIVQLFKNPGEAFARGITVGGVKYMAIKADDSSIYGKKGATGVALAKTGKTIVIGYYDEKQQSGNAAREVEKLAEHLRDNSY